MRACCVLPESLTHEAKNDTCTCSRSYAAPRSRRGEAPRWSR